MLRWFDATIPHTGGRSLRELTILGGGVALCTYEVTGHHVDVGNLCVYAGATLAFALRFFLARAIGVGACLGAIAQQWPHLRLGEVDLATLAVLPVVTMILLCSRDLVERFDRAPQALPGVPNPWAGFTMAQTRTVRWSCYAAGALGGLLDHTLQHPVGVGPLWPRAAMIGIIVAIALLGLGRAIGLVMVWAIGLAVAIRLIPDVLAAERVLAGDQGAKVELYTWLAHDVLPMFVLAAAAALIAAPFTLRLLRRALFGAAPAASE
ncbi:MAG: hypothetical protein R3B09_13880 [Nannocystaceae bacterium]